MADDDNKTKRVPMIERWREEGAFPFEVEIEREDTEEDEETEDEESED